MSRRHVITSSVSFRVTLAGAALTLMTAFPIDGQTSFDYRVLATSKTSTMQKERQDASDAGFEYRDQAVFKSTFGGQEVVCLLERDEDATARKYDTMAMSVSPSVGP